MYNKNNTCCFSGHRMLSQKNREWIIKRLDEEIDKLIDRGVTNFISGGAIGFDYDKLKIMRRSEGQSYNLRHCPSVFFT